MEVVPIHLVPHLMKECCELLNMEWKRSETARLRSLAASCDDLPTCLVLIQNESDTIKVIGHSKLSKIPTVPEGCFVESVVIHPNLRRRGLGKYLMIKTEDYAKSHGFTSIFLSTHDQEIFYGKLGYSVCPPVSIYGSSIQNKPSKEGIRSPKKEDKPVDIFNYCGKSEILSSNASISPPPPPLPPPMPMNEKYDKLQESCQIGVQQVMFEKSCGDSFLHLSLRGSYSNQLLWWLVGNATCIALKSIPNCRVVQ